MNSYAVLIITPMHHYILVSFIVYLISNYGTYKVSTKNRRMFNQLYGLYMLEPRETCVEHPT